MHFVATLALSTFVMISGTLHAQAALRHVPTATFFSDEPLSLRIGDAVRPLPVSVARMHSTFRFEASATQWANLQTERLPMDATLFDVAYEHRDGDREAGVWLIVASAFFHAGSAALSNLRNSSIDHESTAWMLPVGMALGLLAVTGYVFGLYYACLADRVTVLPRQQK